MAFTGVPVVTQVSDRQVRITGVSLDENASGVIGLAEHTGAAVDIALPAAFSPRPYGSETLQDSVEVTVKYLAPDAGANFEPVTLAKTGTTPEDFRITIANALLIVPEPARGTHGLEIYITFH